MRHCLTCLLITTACVLLAGPSPSAGTTSLAKKLRDRIQWLERSGRTDAAVPLYAQLLELAPEDSAAVHGLARALSEQRQYAQVHELLLDWTRRHPHDFAAHVQLGATQLRLNRPEVALDTWDRALQEGEPSVRKYRLVSDQCRAAGMNRQAIRFLKQGREALSQPRLFAWDLSQLYVQTEAHADAVRAYAEALHDHPERYALVEARVLELVREADSASVVLKTLDQTLERMARDSAAPHIALLAATCWLELGRAEAGLERIMRTAGQPGGAELACRFASRCEAHGKRAAAERAFGLCAEHGTAAPLPQRARLEQGRLLQQLGRHERAAELYEQLVRDHPQHEASREALLRLARVQLQELGDVKAARSSLRQLPGREAADQWTREAHELLARVAIREGELEEAAAQLDRLVSLAPDTAFAPRFQRAELSLFQGDLDSAVRSLEELLAVNPGHRLANDALELIWVCDILRNQKDTARRYAAALLAERQGRFEQAQEHWEWLDANAESQVRAMALFQRARARVAAQEPGLARRLLRRLIEEQPGSLYRVPAQMLVAATLAEKGQAAAALQELEGALLAGPEHPRAPEIRLAIQRLRDKQKKSQGPNPAQH